MRRAAIATACVFALLLGGRDGWSQDEETRRKELEDRLVAMFHDVLVASHDRIAAMTSEQKRAFYEEQVDALMESPEGKRYRVARGSGKYAEVGAALASEESALARSSNAASTNPRRVGLLERSGITDLISMALQGTNLLAADDRAVTLNLSAAALLCRTCRELSQPAAVRYQAGGFLNNVGGSITFGSEIPEKEIIGFSGIPDTGKLFDALVWDVKIRLLGDRDPRAAHWDPLILGELGGRTVLSSRLIGDVEADLIPLQGALEDSLERETTRVARMIRSSFQVSVKFSGQHLTKQAGMNKYTGVLMADKGFGSFDGTLNVSYSSIQDVAIASVAGGPDLPVTLKQWRATAGFVGPIWKGLFVKDRSAELALSGEGFFPVDEDQVPLDRKAVYKADLALKIPISDTLELPVSVTYTNDPNELAKKNYVTGRLGISYDFGALKRLAQGK